ncbi:MAG: helix-turn-helix transcriptional regulator [Ruminococcaceae bacterium]|nr:helix-turn-helix transcriptional regulator [Oscillospiraceae bacterium]
MDGMVKEIAERLRGLREMSDYSVAEAAEGIGISEQAYLRYENAQDDIPVSIVNLAAKFYKIDMTELLTGTSPKLRDVCFVKAGEGLSVERYDEYEFQSLAYKFANRKIEPLLVTVSPKDDPQLVTHDGQEFNYLLEGRIKITINKAEYILEPGDSLYHNPQLPHKMVALDDKPAKFLTVILL